MTLVIPARHAINQAMRDIHASARCNGTAGHWLQRSQAALAAGRLDPSSVERDILEGPTATSLTGFRRSDGRRLGRPSTTFRIGRVVADRFVPSFGDAWGSAQEVLVLRREVVEARRDHLEETSSPSGLAVARHAIERIYERERLEHDRVRRRLLADLSDADRTLAFAVAGGLFVHGGPLSRDAYTVLPVGDGLLLVRNVVVAMRKGSLPSTRYVVQRRGVVSTPVATDTARGVAMQPLNGVEVDGHILALGMTYVSADLLFLEQRAYAALFRREAARHDLEALAAHAGRTWLAHERRTADPVIDLDPRLRFLLSQIIAPRPPGHPCLSVGWVTKDHPGRPA